MIHGYHSGWLRQLSLLHRQLAVSIPAEDDHGLAQVRFVNMLLNVVLRFAMKCPVQGRHLLAT